VDIEWGDVLLRAVSGRAKSTTDGGSVTKVVVLSRFRQKISKAEEQA
jgi:hypothetical protein